MSGTIVATGSTIAIKKTIALLLPILAAVESGNNPAAIGDGGRAVGSLQIHKSYWTDACESLGVNWPYSYAKDPDYAVKAAEAYLVRYGRAYENKYGKPATMEILSRLHNGGPEGANPKKKKKYAATSIYWAMVKKKIHN